MESLIKLDRFSPYTSTCYGKNFQNLTDGFLKQFQDSFFYANVIQFIIVGIMYLNMGNGKYWKILFYAASAGMLGSVIENFTVSYICLEDHKDKNFKVVPFLLNEFFWSLTQYAVPLLNLIKMDAFSKGKYCNIIRYIIFGLFIPFFLIRFNIGYVRMIKGYLFDENINNIHNYSFCISAIADLICS
eukprot:jgi/Orpsp1_1/1174480/evm.model.c7180000050289.1